MAEITASGAPDRSARQGGWLPRLVTQRGFQSWAARIPILRGFVRREGAAVFDLVQGFVQSQVLFALVELDIMPRLLDGPLAPTDIAQSAGLSVDRATVLLQAGAALRLLKRRRDGRYQLAMRGAAILGVPGLEAMIRHHRAFYDDLADPVGLLRDSTNSRLAAFWPYVYGTAAPTDVAQRYSDLMAESQVLVAEDLLRMVDFRGISRLMDVGGGSGAFAAAAARAHPQMTFALFDLPEVLEGSKARIAETGLAERVTPYPGSFRDGPLPETGADAISLIRVLYDHEDATVRLLLSRVFAALPKGGRLIVAEPMSGGAAPEPAGDVYFAFYTMAMGTGKARSAARICELCREAGFTPDRTPRAARPYVTSALTFQKV